MKAVENACMRLPRRFAPRNDSEEAAAGLQMFLAMIIDPKGQGKMYFVYILANHSNTTVYTGVTNDLLRRVYEHKNEQDPTSFTAKYHIHKLVFFEETTDIEAAIQREKQIKSWNRARKNQLIEDKNPTWEDLYETLLP